MKVQGNLDSVRKSTIKYIDSFIGNIFSPESFIPAEISEMMQKVTVETGREIAVCLDRRNTVLSVTLGDAHSVSTVTPDIGKRNELRLCGVRQLHSHPNGSPLPSEIDLNTLKDARYDAMIVIGVNREKETVSGASVSILGRTDDGSLSFSETLGPYPPSLYTEFDPLFGYCTELDRTAPSVNLSENEPNAKGRFSSV